VVDSVNLRLIFNFCVNRVHLQQASATSVRRSQAIGAKKPPASNGVTIYHRDQKSAASRERAR